MDKLDNLFELQKEFNKSLGNKIPILLNEVYGKKNNQILKNQFLAIFDEVAEALREIPWKPWKISNFEFDIMAFRLELIDIFHFLINLFIFSGMNAEEVFQLFKMKNKENIKRQQKQREIYGY